jgi:hypothetical protein
MAFLGTVRAERAISERGDHQRTPPFAIMWCGNRALARGIEPIH